MNTLPVVFLVMLALSPSAQAELPNTLSYERLKQLSMKAKSFDEVLPQIYAEVRASHHLVYKTGSLQYASKDQPRIVLAAKDLLLGFTGAENQPGYETVEVLTFDRRTAIFSAHEIRFPGKSAPATGLTKTVIDDEPTKNAERDCRFCHRANLRPNWDGYNAWPGFFGSLSRLGFDVVEEDSIEASYLRDFRGAARLKGRYAFLPERDQQPVGELYVTNGQRFNMVGNGLSPDSNSNLTRELSQINSLRVSQILFDILKAKPEIAPAVTMAFAECDAKSMDQAFPKSMGIDAAAALARVTEIRLRELADLKEEMLPFNSGGRSSTFDPQEFKEGRTQIAWLELVLKSVGESIDDWSMSTSKKRGKYNFQRPDSELVFFQNIFPALGMYLRDYEDILKYGNTPEACGKVAEMSLALLSKRAGQ